MQRLMLEMLVERVNFLFDKKHICNISYKTYILNLDLLKDLFPKQYEQVIERLGNRP